MHLKKRDEHLQDDNAIFASECHQVWNTIKRFFLCRRAVHCDWSSSRLQMLISQPPVGNLTLISRSGITNGVFDLEGLKLGNLVVRCTMQWTKASKKKPGVYEMVEAGKWAQFVGTVDEITGHEMVAMLKTKVEVLLEEGLAVVHKARELPG